MGTISCAFITLGLHECLDFGVHGKRNKFRKRDIGASHDHWGPISSALTDWFQPLVTLNSNYEMKLIRNLEVKRLKPGPQKWKSGIKIGAFKEFLLNLTPS